MALYILFVGPVVLAMVYIASTTGQNLEESVKAADLALARSIAQETDFAMRNALRAIAELSTYEGVAEADLNAMETTFGTFMSARPEVNLVYRLDESGIMIFHYPIGPISTVGDDFSFRTYFERALNTANPLISKGRISPTTNQAVATAVMPIWDNDGIFNGVVATNIKLEALSQTLTKISREYAPEEGFEVFIIDASNQVIAHSNAEQILNQLPESLSQITEPLLLGRVDSVIEIDEENMERLYSYVPVTSAGWGVIVSRPTAAAFATPRAFFNSALATLVIFIVSGLLFWLGLAKLVITPLGLVTAYSRAIGMEDETLVEHERALSSVAVRRDQVGHLARSLMRMEKAIQARLNELSTLLQTSAAVVSTLDPKTVLNRILEQVERLLNVEMSILVALDESLGVFRAQASRGLSKHYVDQIAIDPSEPHSVALRALRSGEPIQISDTETKPSFTANRPRARAEGYRSLLAIPLNTHYAPPSVLLIFRPEPHTFTKQEISILSNFANHAAMAIENAALFARSDMRLQEQTQRLEALIQSLNDGLILEDLGGKVIYANRRISALTGLSQAGLIGNEVNHILDLFIQDSEDPQKAQEQIHRAMEGNEDESAEFSILYQGRNLCLRLHTFKVTDAQGVPIGQGQLFHDITTDRELDRMKSNLISTVSHELRTPLASIKGYASTLLADDVVWDTKAQNEFLSIISSEADRLTLLVNELLDLSRIDAGSLVVERRPCQLDTMINRAAQRSNPQPGERLSVHIPDDFPPIYADRRRIEVVLRNLIENAAKYGGASSPIFVRAFFDDGKITIKVEDEGPGIPEDERSRIFESFYRIDNGLSRITSGAGLGLAICQGFVQAHGGKIWIEPKKHGACFVFTLPHKSEQIQPKEAAYE